VVVAAPVHGGREIGLWREIIRFFISIVLEDYSLYALHLAIPPPWGFHLSNPPNIKSLPREEIKTEIASGMRRRTR